MFFDTKFLTICIKGSVSSCKNISLDKILLNISVFSCCSPVYKVTLPGFNFNRCAIISLSSPLMSHTDFISLKNLIAAQLTSPESIPLLKRYVVMSVSCLSFIADSNFSNTKS